MTRRLLAASACAAIALAAPRAPADSKVTRATLSWVRLPGAESCIAAPALAEAVEERIGHPLFGPASSANLSVEGWVEPAPRPMKLRAVVAIASAKGEVLGTREIVSGGETCDDVVPRLVLAIALMVDPEGIASRAEEPLPPSTPEPAKGPPPPAPPQPGSRAAIQWTLGPLLGVGATPGLGGDAVAPGALMRVLVGPPAKWGVELQLAFFPPHTLIRTESTTLRAHGALLGCPLRIARAVRFDLCAGFAAGATNTNWVTTKPVIDAQITPRIGFRFPSLPLTLGLGVSAGIPLLKPVFPVGGTDYLTPPVYGTADLAVGVELP